MVILKKGLDYERVSSYNLDLEAVDQAEGEDRLAARASILIQVHIIFKDPIESYGILIFYWNKVRDSIILTNLAELQLLASHNFQIQCQFIVYKRMYKKLNNILWSSFSNGIRPQRLDYICTVPPSVTPYCTVLYCIAGGGCTGSRSGVFKFSILSEYTRRYKTGSFVHLYSFSHSFLHPFVLSFIHLSLY